MVKIQRYKVPQKRIEDGETGIYIGGGFFGFVEHKEHGHVIDLPAHGSYGVLAHQGFQPVPVPDEEQPQPEEPSADPSPAFPAAPGD